jgi:hypothetical protein
LERVVPTVNDREEPRGTRFPFQFTSQIEDFSRVSTWECHCLLAVNSKCIIDRPKQFEIIRDERGGGSLLYSPLSRVFDLVPDAGVRIDRELRGIDRRTVLKLG